MLRIHCLREVIVPIFYEGKSISRIETPDRTVELHRVWNRPRINVVKNLIAESEAKHIIEVLSEDFERSKVGFNTSDKKISASRTSSNCWIGRSENPIIAAIEKRISSIVSVPTQYIEPFLVLRYEKGQEYKPHYDFLKKQDEFGGICGDRKYTCLMYLNDLAEDDRGGGTIFHRLGIEIRPCLGTAVLWENLDDSGFPDYETLHSGQPPEMSVKYAMTAWIREGDFPVSLLPSIQQRQISG